MSRRFEKQYAGQGVLVERNIGIFFDWGTTVPTDGRIGYGPGCIFIKRDANGNVSWYRNDGTFASCDFNQVTGGIDLSTLTATAAQLNAAATGTMTTTAGAGITGGTGTVYANLLQAGGAIKRASIMIDLTGLGSSTTDLDIIGQSTTPAYIGQYLTAELGTLLMIRMQCLEAPAGGVADIDLYSAVEATGKFDDAVTGLTETALLTSGGAWANGTTKGATVMPAASEYLYLTGGAGGTAGTYTAGKFLLDFFGY